MFEFLPTYLLCCLLSSEFRGFGGSGLRGREVQKREVQPFGALRGAQAGNLLSPKSSTISSNAQNPEGGGAGVLHSRPSSWALVFVSAGEWWKPHSLCYVGAFSNDISLGSLCRGYSIAPKPNSVDPFGWQREVGLSCSFKDPPVLWITGCMVASRPQWSPEGPNLLDLEYFGTPSSSSRRRYIRTVKPARNLKP